MKNSILCFFIILMTMPSFALVCDVTETSGYVDVPIYHQFTLEQNNFWPRSQEISNLLSSNLKTEQVKIYYQLAEKFDANKKSLIIVAGFYPWLNLGFVTKGPLNFLKKNFNVIEMHFRGSGCSEIKQTPNELAFTHEMIAQDIEYLKNSLGIDKLNIWASSNGAWVSLMFGVLNPNSVENVYLRDTAIYQPTLKEASDHFEKNILPEFLGPELFKKLEYIKFKDEGLYKKILKYAGTLLFRKSEQREILIQLIPIFYDHFDPKTQEVQDLISDLDQKIKKVQPWSKTIYSNECLRTEASDFLLKVEDIYVVEYVYRFCETYPERNNPLFKISNLDFRGHLKHLKNSYFIYQGFWDEYLYKELAQELKNELLNSQIYIDLRAGHGEINQETFPCFAQTLNHFLLDPLTLDPLKYCP